MLYSSSTKLIYDYVISLLRHYLCFGRLKLRYPFDLPGLWLARHLFRDDQYSMNKSVGFLLGYTHIHSQELRLLHLETSECNHSR